MKFSSTVTSSRRKCRKVGEFDDANACGRIASFRSVASFVRLRVLPGYLESGIIFPAYHERAGD